MGRPRQPVHAALLKLLGEQVQSGVVICPLGEGTLVEVLRQSDPVTRLATARLIDELSLGVTIQNAQDRLKTEVVHFLVAATKPGTAMAPPLESVWLKAAYALGVLHPVVQNVDDAEQLALSKAFVDLMWSLTLEELLNDTPLPPQLGLMPARLGWQRSPLGALGGLRSHRREGSQPVPATSSMKSSKLTCRGISDEDFRNSSVAPPRLGNLVCRVGLSAT